MREIRSAVFCNMISDKMPLEVISGGGSLRAERAASPWLQGSGMFWVSRVTRMSGWLNWVRKRENGSSSMHGHRVNGVFFFFFFNFDADFVF